MAEITYADKDKTIQDNVRNKWRDSDANEVKGVVNSKQDANADLDAIAAVIGLGLLKKTAAGTWITVSKTIWIDCGDHNASSGNYPAAGVGSGTAGAIMRFNTFLVTVGGNIGPNYVAAKSILVSLVDTPGNDPANWRII